MAAGLDVIAGLVFVLALVPALLFLVNFFLYRPPLRSEGPLPPVSVLIPARNEELAIVDCVESALSSEGVDIEVVVLDDHSDDRTATLVEEIARRDPRVRLERAPDLPPGWCGKQHACWVLAGRARHDLLLFLDADVRLERAGLARMVSFLTSRKVDLVSGIPRQETCTFLEKLVIPLIHFILLGFLPIRRMRKSSHPAYSAGCGQLFLATREGYDTSGGHSVIRTTLHDGLELPRAFRKKGRMTDLCETTTVAWCRMYQGAGQVVRGLAKNATEGLASPRMIVPATFLLLGGQVAPFLLIPFARWFSPVALGLVLGGMGLAYFPRVLGALAYRQSWLGVVLHPVGVGVLVAIQWYALGRSLAGRPATWKGRAYHPIEG